MNVSGVDVNIGDAVKGFGSVLTSIREAITGEKITDPQALAELEYKFKELELQWKDVETKVIDFQHNVIIAEAQGESWLQRNWRPMTMLTFVFIIANNYILVPYFSALFSIQIPALDLTAEMWNLLTVGLGGYVVGRSAEKVAKSYFGAKT